MARKKISSNLKRNLFVVGSLLLLIAYLFITEDMVSLSKSFQTIDWWYVILGALFTISFIVCDSVSIYLFRREIQKDAKFSTSLRSSFISIGLGFVTPFQSGYLAGQIAVLGKKGMSASDAATVVLKKTIRYLGFGIIANIALIVINKDIFNVNTAVLVMVIISIAATVLYLVFLALVSKAEKTLTAVFCSIIRFGKKIHLVKDSEKLQEKIKEQISLLKHRMNNQHESLWINFLAMIFCLAQLLFLYLVTWAVYMAFNHANPQFTMLQVIGGQGLCNVILQVSPIPGGIGIVDAAFKNIMTTIMGSHLTISMILWRLLALYLPIMLCFIMFGSSKNKNIKEENKSSKMNMQNLQ